MVASAIISAIGQLIPIIKNIISGVSVKAEDVTPIINKNNQMTNALSNRYITKDLISYMKLLK